MFPNSFTHCLKSWLFIEQLILIVLLEIFLLNLQDASSVSCSLKINLNSISFLSYFVIASVDLPVMMQSLNINVYILSLQSPLSKSPAVIVAFIWSDAWFKSKFWIFVNPSKYK